VQSIVRPWFVTGPAAVRWTIMTCAKHNLRMVGLALRGWTGSRAHAALLADVRRCPRCAPPAPVARPAYRPEPRIPRVRVEQSAGDLVDVARR
jgi:hypothetical protein